MAASAPFEPNPLVPTLIFDLHAANWERVLVQVGHAFVAEDAVWQLGANVLPRRTTIGALNPRVPPADALYLPPLAPEAAKRSLHGLRQVVHRLRAPGGCPWDAKQTHASLLPHVLEEAYEVADAIRGGDPNELADELGDLLLQVVLQSELADEDGQFTLNDVAQQISAKLIRRHPHVFGDLTVTGAAEVERNWDELKAVEKADRTSVLDGMPRSLPALVAAQEVQKRLKKVGFDWPDGGSVQAKLAEELAELRDAPDPSAAEAELGDVLFILARLGLDLGADAEESLRGANARVAERFRFVESRLRERGQLLRDVAIEELLVVWDEAKTAEAH